MTGLDEKNRRLACWYELLSNPLNTGTLDAWHRELRREVYQLKTRSTRSWPTRSRCSNASNLLSAASS